MDDLKKSVPYIVFEGEMTRAERTIHRLWISTILLLLALLGTNAGWIYYESQFEYFTETTVTQEAEADNGSDIRLIGGDYVESEADEND
jgi:hypothetical protein